MSHDRKLIYFSRSIQPHGILLVLSHPELKILQVSVNTQAHLGIPHQNLLGQTLDTLLEDSQIQAINKCLSKDFSGINPSKILIRTPKGDRSFNVLLHRTTNVIVLELEPVVPQTQENFFSISALLKGAIAQLQQVSSTSEFLQLVTQEVRNLTGFDRVMVYQFDFQGAGKVIAEAKQDHLPSYLDLHYPATDIPEPVREAYKRGMSRFIPDLSAQAIELVPPKNLVTQQPLDFSLAVLRSVDPCCVEYHQNIGVAAIMVISLVKGQTLWGLISCHHQTPKFVPYEIREACELLAQFVVSELTNKVDREELDYIVKLRSLQSDFIESISQADNLKQALVNPAPRLLDLVNAQGAAVCLEDEITLVGLTPTVEQVRDLIDWADTQVSNPLFHTNLLPKLYPETLAFKDVASGLLLLQISKVRRCYILWFRPEVLQTVNWAGNPNGSTTVKADGTITLSPRKSFEQWQETVQFTSLPWKACELEQALDLRNAIVGIVLNKADELAQINQELERSNQELDSFAYAASHDLKEPLRGIHNFSTLLLRGYESVLDDVGKSRLQTLIRLTRRMESLIDVLLKFSRLGQAELHFVPTDINLIVNRVLEDLRISRQDFQAQIRIPRPLPVVNCDPVLISEVFTNLLSNALKYNNKAEQWIEIGYLGEEGTGDWVLGTGKSQKVNQQSSQFPITFYVKDNGIGIRERHLDIIFRLFKRLHEQHLYGGGTGAGLTITKKIIERHGGRIWVESTVDVGSTFYFSLA
ncbi:ATP-binding protein [Chlorogloeopsis sp. ULAP01]|uniref:ATP-binding protein n=1 Tax=Chlorogloeopsis sp. ULAP01 TaxID=3056483 RepID=UPI0025AA64E5|nr:ATP-binding protein [Chlorogloeopsis sp. ULAP01]MDM9385667.1 ATP-binding protein [Chlorogloeopsis sp. ULAP01]